ncbi:MAG: Nif3-like dinuclear metal center hexameric protein [Promethearchaeota archaeon]|jgi:putative NIF3 family GTP cyclohydrolase 1 type 2
MKAKKLYKKLDSDFELDKCKDDWKEMEYNQYISDNFKRRYMGILLDNSQEIDSVYTAVFPSDKVLNKLLNLGKGNILLVTHHPMIWDIRNPSIFLNISKNLLPILRQKKISIYSIHVPLDRVGEYSTGTSLARALGIDIEGEFYEYFGAMVGVYGKTVLNSPEELAGKLSSVVGHKTKLWKYGSDEIFNQRVAVVGGGGNNIEGIEEIVELGINTYVTGVTVLNDFSKKTHEFEKEKEINIIGGTHYSTEKFACIALCKYFENIGLKCEFIEDQPVLEDIE